MPDISVDEDHDYLLYQDNGDGTTKIEGNLGGDRRTMIIPVSLYDLVGQFMPAIEENMKEEAEALASQMVQIPNDVEGAEDA